MVNGMDIILYFEVSVEAGRVIIWVCSSLRRKGRIALDTDDSLRLSVKKRKEASRKGSNGASMG